MRAILATVSLVVATTGAMLAIQAASPEAVAELLLTFVGSALVAGVLGGAAAVMRHGERL